MNAISLTINIAPVVIQTFFKHHRKKARKKIDRKAEAAEQPTDWILFDEAFHVVKAFLHLGSEHTVEALQAFTNTHVPHPYWATVVPIQVPLYSCNQAADALKSWFAEDELRDIVGGERWWQVRGLSGIDAEWIAMNDDIDAMKPEAAKNTKETRQRTQKRKAKLRKGTWVEEDMAAMDKLDRVMLYVHGGGYFCGSINTHRYQIIRFARKMAGRCFAVNYRKAPQYPWPCPLQDVLAAYLYLIHPPKNALHSAVDPRLIVIAGDSAGGGLTITLLTILRDLGLPMPAGAVAISPWVDLTHSFPSVLKNIQTDILPPHGFIYKPSTLWPVPTIATARAVPADTLPTNTTQTAHRFKAWTGRTTMMQCDQLGADRTADSHNMEDYDCAPSLRNNEEEPLADQEVAKPLEVKPELETLPRMVDQRITSQVKVAMPSLEEPVLELRSQIQLYATNELSVDNLLATSLTHPLVSPVLQGSLGDLCPLYIIAGDGELLRDEIIYFAHRAASPSEYPIRKELLEGPRQAENARMYTRPTSVRLQVFDGMCHVGPTAFSFTRQSAYAYRSISEFVKHVTSHSPQELAERPFPPTPFFGNHPVKVDSRDLLATASSFSAALSMPEMGTPSQESAGRVEPSEMNMNIHENAETHVPGHSPDKRVMVRERVDVHGRPRPMEPPSELDALQLPHDEIGRIKEGPVKRWLLGQEKWDVRFKRTAKRAKHKREKLEWKAEKLFQDLSERCQQGQPPMNPDHTPEDVGIDSREENTRRWGPLDLVEENPPPSAIVGRRDTPDSLALMKTYFLPADPPAVRRVDAVSAAFGRRDAVVQPRQSPAEQQVENRIIPGHGLSMWSNLTSLFLKMKVRRKTKSFGDGVAGSLIASECPTSLPSSGSTL